MVGPAALLWWVCLPVASGATNRITAIRFEENEGQSEARAKYIAHGRGFDAFFGPDSAEISFVGSSGQLSHLRFQWLGGRAKSRLEGVDLLPGRTNYFIGYEPTRWHANVPNYSRLAFRQFYPGIDLIFHGNQDQLEYDLVLSPGADSREIQMRIVGASSIVVDEAGDLVIHTRAGIVKQHRPAVWQDVHGERLLKDAAFVLAGADRVALRISHYDKRKTLVVDPVISFSGTLGSSATPPSVPNMVAVDATGVYVTNNSGPSSLAPLGTISITKLDPTLSTVLYTTYFGPQASGVTVSSYSSGVAVDASGSAYVTGYTSSTSFPTTPGAFQQTGGDPSSAQFKQYDAFLTKLSPAGDTLVYSTYLGGNADDQPTSIAVDAFGSAYVAGWTQSSNFPTTPGAYQTGAGGGAFVTAFTPDGSGLVYSTLLGQFGDVVNALALDSNRNIYVAGTASGPFPFPVTPGAYQTQLKGQVDGFVAKLNSSGSALLYSTLIGGSQIEYANAIAVDLSGNAYIAGQTSSSDFPVTSGALQSQYGGGQFDAFVAKLSADGATLLYSTYLGGSGDDRGVGIGIDGSGRAIVVGPTTSADFPVVNPVQAINAGLTPSDPLSAFVTRLDPTGSSAVYSTYLGGSIGDDARAVALDSSANAYVTGLASSANFPLTPGTIQTALVGSDAYILKIADPTDCTFAASITQSDSTGGTISVTAPTGCFWYSAANADWFSFGRTTSGTGSGAVTYTLTANNGPARSTNVSVAGQLLNIAQPDGCVYSHFGPLSLYQFATGGIVSIDITTGQGCAWSAASNASWITPIGLTTQSGSGGIGFNVAPNQGANAAPNKGQQRSGTISAAGLTFTVTEESNCGFYFSGSSSQTFGPPGGTGSLGLNTAGPNCQWTVLTPDSPWVTILGPTSGTGSGGFSYSVAPNTGAGRTATIPVADQTGFVQTFTIAQPAVAGNTVVGQLEEADCTKISGWAADKNQLNVPILVAITGNGITTYLTADQNRPDIGALLGDNGNHGFSIATPSFLVDGKLHSVVVYATENQALIGAGSVQCGAPQLLSVSPSSGSGGSQTFVATYGADGNPITLAYFMVNSAVISPLSCFVEYNVGTHSYRLLDDAGTTWSASVWAGSSGTASNSQCTISGAGGGVSASGNNLAVNFPITFSSSYAGAKSVFLLSIDSAGLNSGWQQPGMWTVTGGGGGSLPPGAIPVCNQSGAPCVASLTPTNGNSLSGAFTGIFTHSGGASQHYLGYILFLPTPNVVNYTATGSCLVEYNRISNAMRLINDAGTNWLPGILGIPIGQGGTLTNSHCTLDVAHSSAQINGTIMSVTAAVTFNPGFMGQLATFMQGFDVTGAYTGMTQFGNWVAAPGAQKPGPYVVNVSPTSGAGSSTKLTFTAGHTSGVSSLSFITMLISSVIVGGTPCQVFYSPASNTLNLVNDAGTAMVSSTGIEPGTAGTLANSRCTINTGEATELTSGNNVTMSVVMTFNTGTFDGAKNVYVNAFDNFGLLSHWVASGTWTVQ